MAPRVVEQVADHPEQLGPHAQHDHVLLEVRDDRHLRRPAGDLLGRQVPEVDALLHGRAAGSEPRHEQQVGDDGLHPVGVAQGAVHQAHQVGVIGMQPRLLQLRAEPGDRGAQLVGGVGGEPPLLLDRVLQARQRAVDGPRQVGELVLARRLLDPARQVADGDVGELRLDVVDRAETAVGPLPGDPADQPGEGHYLEADGHVQHAGGQHGGGALRGVHDR